MAIIVKGGGGKPEEEKTVTAGTSVIEVLPSSGKTMKKVTVNPTPSQSKTVTPSTSQQTVLPDSGNLLSSVAVYGDSNLVAENIKSGVNIFGVYGTFDNSNGTYVWKKLTAQGGDFLDFVVSDQSAAYPDGGTQDGYWYEKVVEGVSGIDYGFITLSSNQSSITVDHNLGVVPTHTAIFATGTINTKCVKMVTEAFVAYGSGTYSDGSGHISKDSNQITFKDMASYGVYYESAASPYLWIAIA